MVARLVRFGMRRPAAPKRPVVGVTEVSAIACCLVPVPGVQLAISCGCRPVCVVLPTAPDTGHALAFLCEPVSLLSAQITLIGAFDEDRDAGIGLDRLHLAQDGVPVALTPVGFLVAPVGSAISLVGLPVPPVCLPFAPIGLAVAPIRLPVTLVQRQVSRSAGIALVRGVVALSSRLVARLGGLLPLRGGLVSQVRVVLSPLRR